MYSVIDLFAGAGGLSLGFMQTQKYDIKVAFENSPDMQKTYRLNHPGVEVLDDVCKADYADIERRYGKIDVVIGGPPCQGFSNANRQKNHAISQNNMLVKQYVRAILELDPKAFVMENVSMLRSEVHRFYLSHADEDLVREYAIPVKESELVLLEKKYLFDGVDELLKDCQAIRSYLWPEDDYSELNVIYKATKNAEKIQGVMEKHQQHLLRICASHKKQSTTDIIEQKNEEAFSAIEQYYSGEVEIKSLQERIAPAIMIQRMLSKAIEISDNDLIVDRYEKVGDLVAVIRSFAVSDYLKHILESEQHGYVINSGVLCAADFGAPQKRMRFVVMGVKKSISEKIALPLGQFIGKKYRTVRDAIGDLEDIPTVTNLADDAGAELPKLEAEGLTAQLRNSTVLRNHIVTATTDTAMKRFKALKQGENFHALDDALKTNTYTDVNRTQNTIYLRLNYDEPSGTVVNVRKSMWIHPTLDRAVSIREAARLQTFPDSFVFCGSKDKQYQQVGNAVPPIMAKSIAKKLSTILKKGLEQSEEDT